MLEAGEIIEEGPPEKLLSNTEGRFYRMHNDQKLDDLTIPISPDFDDDDLPPNFNDLTDLVIFVAKSKTREVNTSFSNTLVAGSGNAATSLGSVIVGSAQKTGEIVFRSKHGPRTIGLASDVEETSAIGRTVQN